VELPRADEPPSDSKPPPTYEEAAEAAAASPWIASGPGNQCRVNVPADRQQRGAAAESTRLERLRAKWTLVETESRVAQLAREAERLVTTKGSYNKSRQEIWGRVRIPPREWRWSPSQKSNIRRHRRGPSQQPRRLPQRGLYSPLGWAAGSPRPGRHHNIWEGVSLPRPEE
jgi:hypothetical protein